MYVARLASHPRALILVLAAAGSVFPLQPFHRCLRTGMRGPGGCCTVREVEAPACASCGRHADDPERASGETGFHALSGPCCLISYTESPRIGAASEASRLLPDAPAPGALVTIGEIEIGAPVLRLAPRRARAGPEPPGRPPLFILHASLLL